jgi:HEAT repeat protein
MKKLLIAAALMTAGTFLLQDVSRGHGGTYRGPGDTVPPGGGGAPGGPGGAPAGPGSPAPAGPTSPGPGTPGGPVGTPSGSGPSTGGGGDSGPDLSLWQYWWGFNKEPYLNLKAAIHSAGEQTGSDDFFLGQGQDGQQRNTLKPSETTIREQIVPALIRSLEASDKENDIATGCMIALAKIGDAKDESGKSRMAEQIIKRLGDSNQEISETAAVSLGILANEANIDLLVHLLHDEGDKVRAQVSQVAGALPYSGRVPERTRSFAAYGLGLIGKKASIDGKKKIVDALLRYMEQPGIANQREVPVACLTSLGLTPLEVDPSFTLPDLSKGFEKPAKVTNLQEQVLYLMSFYTASPTSTNYLQQAHAPVAVSRLIPAREPKLTPLYDAVVKRFVADISSNSGARNEAIQSCTVALGQMADCDDDPHDVAVRKALMGVKDAHADQQSRFFALVALAQACGRPGTGEGNTAVGGVVTKDKDANARNFLLEQLSKAKQGNHRAWVAIAMGVMERALADRQFPTSPEVQLALRQELEKAKTPIEIGGMSIALGILEDSAAAELMIAKLEKSSDDEARGYVAVGLGLLNERKAIPAITEVVKKSKYKADLLKSAAIGLGLLGDKEIVPQLLEMLSSAEALSSQAAISSALGFIGDARSVTPLIDLLQDGTKTPRARGFAAVALGIVADKDTLPWNSNISVNINYRANTPTLTSPSEGTGILDIL